LERVVVGVDPAVTASRGSHETGIVACAISKERQYFVLEDAFCRATPRGWAERVSVLSEKWNASRIVCESNQGGMLVEELLRSFNSELPYIGACTRRRGSRAVLSRSQPSTNAGKSITSVHSPRLKTKCAHSASETPTTVLMALCMRSPN